MLEGLEECDDGNTGDGDGCSASCMVGCRWLASLVDTPRVCTCESLAVEGRGAPRYHSVHPRLFSSIGWHPLRCTSQLALPPSLPCTRRWSLDGPAAPPAPRFAPRAVHSHTASPQTRTLALMLLQPAVAAAAVPVVAVAALRRHHKSTTAAAGPWPPLSWRRSGRPVPWCTLAGSAFTTTSLRQGC